MTIGDGRPSDSATQGVFVILLENVKGATMTPDLIRRHIAHLRTLDASGRLVLCGPFSDYAGGMIVVRAKDKAEAEVMAMADPFVAEGARTYSIRSLILANAGNDYLGKS